LLAHLLDFRRTSRMLQRARANTHALARELARHGSLVQVLFREKNETVAGKSRYVCGGPKLHGLLVKKTQVVLQPESGATPDER